MPEIERLAKRAIAERVFPGCAVGILTQGERKMLACGRLTFDRDAPKVAADTIYDLASVTKSIPIASLIAQFVDEGKLALNASVRKYVPELHNDHNATLEDLLRYRVQGPRMSQLRFETFEQIRTHMLEQGFTGPPSDGAAYSNAPAFFLGLILERMSGEILPALADRYFFAPLSMADTTFFPHDKERTAPTEMDTGEVIRGIVHDESARVFARSRRAAGHAGLFSTVEDLLTFFQALCDGKFPSVVVDAQKGLGWQLAQPWFMGRRCGQRTFGKTGFTGTSVVCDMEKKTALVILANRTYPARPPDAAQINSAMNTFRAAVADVVFG